MVCLSPCSKALVTGARAREPARRPTLSCGLGGVSLYSYGKLLLITDVLGDKSSTNKRQENSSFVNHSGTLCSKTRKTYSRCTGPVR